MLDYNRPLVFLLSMLLGAVLAAGPGCKTEEPDDDDSAADDDDVGDDDTASDFPAGITALDGIDVGLPTDDLAPFGALIGDTRAVALGESSHAAGGMLQLKHRLIRYLVEEQGFRAVAIETDWDDAQAVNEYLQTCQGDPAEVVTTSMRDVWHAQSVADLLQWLCEFNQANPGDPIVFFGFNIYQAWHDGPALIAFVDQMMPAKAKALTTDIARCEGVTSGSEAAYFAGNPTVDASDYDACLAALEVVETFFDDNETEIIAQLSEEELRYLRLRLVGLRAWEIHRRYEPLPEALNARDEAMAIILLELWDMLDGDAKVAISTHSLHANTNSDEFEFVYPQEGADYDYWEDMIRMGVHLETALGDDYTPLSIVSYHHNWDSIWVDPTADQLEDLPEGPEIVELMLHDLDEPYLFVDLAFPGAQTPFLTPDETYRLTYPFPLGMDIITTVVEVVPGDHYEALIYLEEVVPWEQLQ